MFSLRLFDSSSLGVQDHSLFWVSFPSHAVYTMHIYPFLTSRRLWHSAHYSLLLRSSLDTVTALCFLTITYSHVTFEVASFKWPLTRYLHLCYA